MDVEETFNYIGATIFWLYIIAALYFSLQIISTIRSIKPAQDANSGRGKYEDVLIFTTLALISFATLSSNMLHVLIQSYQLWSARRGMSATLDLRRIWQWSITSTLFQDFGEALIASDERYLWVQTALFATMSVCVFMAVAGRQRRVPRLGLFFCLSQILPISFALNLFYIALSRLPERPQQKKPKVSYGILLCIGAYSICLLYAPWTAGAFWLLVTILTARALLFSPLLLVDSAESGSRGIPGPMFTGAEEAQTCVGVAVYLFTIHQGYRVLGGREETTSLYGLFDHPAVSSLGCDLVLCVASYAVWTYRSRTRPASISASKTE